MRTRKVTITPEVREVLSKATVAGPAERPTLKLNQPGLERKLYEAVDKVLRALGGKWDRGAAGHTFSRPFEGELKEALESGVAVDQAKTNEQFFTPNAVADLVWQRAGLEADQLVLEPSAGQGALLNEPLRLGCKIVCVEKDPVLADLLRPLAVEVHCADFMTWEPERGVLFDRVLMNPPFSVGQDTDHVLRAFDLLRPGGRLVSIMGTHWTFAGDRKACAFRDWLTDLMPATGHSWADLPPGSFSESGTGVATGVLTINKGN